jgi:hypothetical protein
MTYWAGNNQIGRIGLIGSKWWSEWFYVTGTFTPTATIISVMRVL